MHPSHMHGCGSLGRAGLPGDARERIMHAGSHAFRFIDLFAGIGGLCVGFEAFGGRCVFTSE
jgi:hypothetical protein